MGLTPDEKNRIIEEIMSMRKERMAIKQQMEAISQRMEELNQDSSISAFSSNQTNPKVASRNYTTSCRVEAINEEALRKDLLKRISSTSSKKTELLNLIQNELDTFQNKEITHFYQIQTSAIKTRSEIEKTINQLSAALLELRPDDTLQNQITSLLKSSQEKSTYVINKQAELVNLIKVKFSLLDKKVEINEDAWQQKMCDKKELTQEIARRRTSDLPTLLI